jgi:hypothetical protein
MPSGAEFSSSRSLDRSWARGAEIEWQRVNHPRHWLSLLLIKVSMPPAQYQEVGSTFESADLLDTRDYLSDSQR